MYPFLVLVRLAHGVLLEILAALWKVPADVFRAFREICAQKQAFKSAGQDLEQEKHRFPTKGGIIWRRARSDCWGRYHDCSAKEQDKSKPLAFAAAGAEFKSANHLPITSSTVVGRISTCQNTLMVQVSTPRPLKN